ncbi:MAG: hypothetical protein H8K07_01680 [Nitrospira sp.]|nr:hypothetical protein [Nitrospira sp.]
MSTHPNRDLLYSMSIEEQEQLPRTKLLALRRSVYAEHVRQMEVRPEIARWAAQMNALYPDGFKIWENKLNILEALMVARYGEDTRHWPQAFSQGDVDRAKKWLGGKTPAGVKVLSADGLSLMSCAFLAVGAFGLLSAIFHDSALGLFFLPFLFGTAMTDYLENKLADHLFRTTTFTQPSILGIALYTAAPGETGGGTEVTGGSYARVANNPANANWNGTHGNTTGASSGTGGLVDNAGTLTFPAPSANWGTVTHFAILDNTTGGNMLIYGALAVSKTVNASDPAPTFPAGTLDITFA